MCICENVVVSQFGKYCQAELVKAGFIYDLMPVFTIANA